MLVVSGIDVHPRGWVAVTLAGSQFHSAAAAASLADLVARLPKSGAIGVDIPIGLPATGWRSCDRAAYGLLGARRSSLFLTPPRPALEAPSFAEALALCRELTGAGLSRQAYALAPRVLEAEAVAAGNEAVFEVHPELSFRAMAGRPAAASKRSWAGMWERLALLRAQGIELPAELAGAGLVPAADLIDAAAAAWTAARRTAGRAQPVAAPETDRTGRLISIWY